MRRPAKMVTPLVWKKQMEWITPYLKYLLMNLSSWVDLFSVWICLNAAHLNAYLACTHACWNRSGFVNLMSVLNIQTMNANIKLGDLLFMIDSSVRHISNKFWTLSMLGFLHESDISFKKCTRSATSALLKGQWLPTHIMISNTPVVFDWVLHCNKCFSRIRQ